MGQKYAVCDKNGFPIAFYDSSIHENIPEDAIEISEEDWQAHINGQRKVYKDGSWVDYIPSDTEILEQAKITKLAEIKSAYETEIASDIPYMNTTFQADKQSQDMISKVLVSSGGNLPNGFFWLDVDNNQVPMTYTDLQGLANAILLRGQQAFAKYQTLKQKVNNATAIDEVNSIVW